MIVQRKVEVVPTGTLTAVLLPVGVAIIAEPLTTDHEPDVGAGSLPVTVNAELLHCVGQLPMALAPQPMM